MNRIFVPHSLEKIEVDVKNKIFKVNGEDFGMDCTGFTITCKPDEWKIRTEIDTTVSFTTYDTKGEQTKECTFESRDAWFKGADKGLNKD